MVEIISSTSANGFAATDRSHLSPSRVQVDNIPSGKLQTKYGSQLLPNNLRSIDAISRCRTPDAEKKKDKYLFNEFALAKVFRFKSSSQHIQKKIFAYT